MRPDNAIEVRNVTKSFKVFIDRGNTIKERALFSARRKYDYRQVLKGISFDVKKGEAIGLIGSNGCGKSTTLKLLTKIIYPDSGSIDIKGRVSSLIELGAGFHPDLSGKENIYINAAIFGLSKKEIDKRRDDIIAFSELEEYIDNPVRTYSSGMYMRLAFAVAINVDADVLLIDEILAVGDANFQAKCFNKLREIKAKGTTIVIVSHSLGQIEQICERSVWIHEGVIKAEGSPREIHPAYLDYMGQKRQETVRKEVKRQGEKEEEQKLASRKESAKRWGNGKARITGVELLDDAGKMRQSYKTGEDIKIRLTYAVRENVDNAVVGIGIFRNDGLQCYGTNTQIDGLEAFALEKDGIAEIQLEKINLLPGRYLLDVALETDAGIPVDYYREAVKFEIYSTINDVGVTRIWHQWNIK